MSTLPQVRRNRTVLILEADEGALEVARGFLTMNRFDAVCERDLKSALLAATGKSRPDAVLLNFRLHREVTTELVRKIRQHESDSKCDRLPLIVTSAVLDVDWTKDSLAAGADRVLPMPFSERQLLAEVAGAISDARYFHLRGDPVYEFARSLDVDDDDGPGFVQLH